MGLFDLFRKKYAVSDNEKRNPSFENIEYGEVEKYELLDDYGIIGTLRTHVIVFDVETTGLNPTTDRIIEIGAIEYKNAIPVNSFSTLVNPGIKVKASASEVNHITDDMIACAPNESKVYSEFSEFLGSALTGDTILCAYNASFDMNFLCNTLSRLGYNAKIKYVDMLHLARKYVNEVSNHKQQTVANYFGFSNRNEHRADADAEVCGQILFKTLDLMIEAKRVFDEENAMDFPSIDELEVYAVIQNAIRLRGGDVSAIRYIKNSSGFACATLMYNFMRIKTVKNKKYIIIPKEITNGLNLLCEDCSLSEGGANLDRVFFNNPYTLEPLFDYLYTKFCSAYKILQDYISESTYRQKEFINAQRERRAITETEEQEMIKSARCREYEELNYIASKAITIDQITLSPTYKWCKLSEIDNQNNSIKGEEEGMPYYFLGEEARKNGDYNKALDYFDISRKKGYCDAILYEAYAKVFHTQKLYSDEIVVIEEFLSRVAHGGTGKLKSRRDKAIAIIFAEQEADRKKAEKKKEAEERALEAKKKKEEAAQNTIKPIGRHIIQTDDEGNIIKEFESISAASLETGINTKSLRDAANGVQKHAGGFCWRFNDTEQ